MIRALSLLPVGVFVLLACEDTSTNPPPVDGAAPARVEDLTVERLRGAEVVLGWTAPGDDGMDGRAARYSIRYSAVPLTEAKWDSATVVDSPPVPRPANEAERFTLSELPEGTWYLGLKSADEVPNWSALSNVVNATLGTDTIPPGPVTDLAVGTVTSRSVTLSWTAPGNDGDEGWASEYDLRYALDTITDETWEDATPAESIPAPGSAGTAESFSVAGLEPGTLYFFGLRSADEVPNWSALSNVVTQLTTEPDATPPGRVTDLAVAFTTTRRVTLGWTAPGDDGAEGMASEYDLRYALSPITDESWEDAIPVSSVPVPEPAGAAQTAIVTGLETETSYFFALRAGDEEANWSAISNIVSELLVSPLRLTMTQPNPGAYRPAWSPDGRIAYDSDAGHLLHYQIYVMPLDGSGPLRLTNDADYAWYPSWSPDGAQLAFSTHRYGGERSGLWVMDAVPGALPTLLASHGDGYFARRGSWSPDGSRIVYSVTRNTPPDPRISTAYFAPGDELFLEDAAFPSWSPDGSSIAFYSDRSGNNDIWVASASGGSPVQLTHDPALDLLPAWSPDGHWIAFASWRGGTDEGDIWVMSSTGGSPTQLTFDPARDSYPTWSPDGTEIAFESNRSGNYEIWVVAVPHLIQPRLSPRH